MTKINHETFLSGEGIDRSKLDVVQAVHEYQATLKEQDQTRDPLGWARAMFNLAIAMAAGDQTSYRDETRQAISILREALPALDTNELRPYWAMVQYNIGSMEFRTAQVFADKKYHYYLKRYDAAMCAFRAARSVWHDNEMPVFWASVTYILTSVYQAKFRSFRFEEDRKQGLIIHKQLIDCYKKKDENWHKEKENDMKLIYSKRAYEHLDVLSKISQKELKSMGSNNELIYG